MAHEGHRQRMFEKLESGSLLHEHELLEILLFAAYPRKNTNPIAHALLDAFGSVRGVFEASLKELTEVDGVGESVADFILAVSACAKLAYSAEGTDVFLNNYGSFKEYTAKRLRKKTEEVLEIYFLEKNGRVKYIYSVSDKDKHKVTMDREEISKLFASQNPFGILIAHNHLTGDSSPSDKDDNFTAQMQMICSLNGVTLYDHCIYASDNDVYSYFYSGKIDQIKLQYSVSSIINDRK